MTSEGKETAVGPIGGHTGWSWSASTNEMENGRAARGVLNSSVDRPTPTEPCDVKVCQSCYIAVKGAQQGTTGHNRGLMCHKPQGGRDALASVRMPSMSFYMFYHRSQMYVADLR